MTDESADVRPLFGVQVEGGSVRVAAVGEAFGRVRRLGRDVVQDLEGWPGFHPLSFDRQRARAPIELPESRAGEALVESIANGIAQLAFGLRGPGLRVAVALGEHMANADLELHAGGPRVPELASRLRAALAGRGVTVEVPTLAALDDARVLGERWAPTGSLAGLDRGVIVHWGDDARILLVREGGLASTILCPPAGLEAVEREYRSAGEERRLGSAARRGDARVLRLLGSAASELAARVTAELTLDPELVHGPPVEVPISEEASETGDAPLAGALVLSGPVAQILRGAGPALEERLLAPFERALEAVGAPGDDGARTRISLLAEAPLLGAATLELGLDRGSARATRP